MAQGRLVSRTLERDNRVLLIQIAPLEDDRAESIGAVGLVRDITAAEKLEQTRRDYIANVSHELRTPLTALRGLIEPLSDGLVAREEDRQRYYGIILAETLRLSRLIDDMLELSRLQAGRIALRREAFDLGPIVASLRERYQTVAEEQGVDFAITGLAEACPQVYSNPDRIEQVLVILIDNALKFTPEGGRIVMNIGHSRDRVVISIRDSGVGMSADDQAHVFERFYKADKSRGKKAGTGLGLSIAHEMMDALGERIWVRSQLGRGSTFFITIALARTPTD